MKKMTNKQHVPKALADAVRQSASEYNNFGSDLSASSVLKPVRIYWLEKRHADEIVTDVADNIWAFLGTATHYAAEKAGEKDKGTIAEERYFKDIKGWKFSAQIDNYEIKRKILTDFKITSVYSIMGKVKDDWTIQLNSQKMLMEEAGYPVERIQICAIGRDWNKNGVMRKGYPKHQVKLIPIELWSNEETQKKLEERIKLLQSHEHTPDEDLPMCTEAERWATPAKHAVMKDKKAKRATKLHDCPDTAATHAEDIGGIVQERRGEDKRCEQYCDVNRWCDYFKGKYSGPTLVKSAPKLMF